MRDFLFVSDLDGTLLPSSGKFSRKQLEDLQNLIDDEKLNFTFATARETHSVKPLFPENFRFRLPIIAGNGAYLQDINTMKTSHERYLSEEDFKILIPLLNENPEITPVVCGFDKGNEVIAHIEGHESEGTKYYLARWKGDKRFIAYPKNTQIQELLKYDIFTINLMDEYKKLLPIYEIIKNDPRFYIVFHQELYRPEWWLSIYNCEAGKGKAIRTLKEELGCRYTVVFGDASNDITAFKMANFSFAVKNAVPELKEVATGIIPSNDESGVITTLQKLKTNLLL